MKKDDNAFIKVLITLVIASLALLAIVYFMLLTNNNRIDSDPNLKLIQKNVSKEEMDKKMAFDKKGRLLIGEDIEMMGGEDWFEKCEGSKWNVGEEKEYWYYSEKYGYKMKVAYTEFYNDDLIAPAYRIMEEGKVFNAESYILTVDGEENTFLCDAHGPVPGIGFNIDEANLANEIKANAEETVMEGMDLKFEKLTIGKWDAVSFMGYGYMDIVHIVLLGEDNNYWFSISFEENKDKLIDFINNNFILIK